MRRRLLDLFEQWEQDYEGDPLREDAYIRVQRVHKLLRSVSPIQAEDEKAIPPTSHLREFIGGSCYEY
jgi:hypothetical protein